LHAAAYAGADRVSGGALVRNLDKIDTRYRT
jgi:hypothetical protein